MGRLPHPHRDRTRRKRRGGPRRAGAPRAAGGARLRPQAHLYGLLRRHARRDRTHLRGEPPLLLQLPALVHVLALLPLELRGAPERHTAPAHDDHRRQLALGHQMDRREVPRTAGEPAARGGRQQGPQHLLLPAVPAGTRRAALPAQPRPAQLLDRHVAIHHDGYRAGLLLQHLAGRTPRTRLRLCRLVLRLLDLDRLRRAGPARTLRTADRARHGGDRRRDGRLHGRSRDSGGPELGRPRPVGPLHGARHRLELPPVHAAQLHHHQLRRQRHLPALEQSGGLWRASRRADHEHLLSGRRMVHRRDEDPRQRRSGRALLAAQEQIHPYERLHPGI